MRKFRYDTIIKEVSFGSCCCIIILVIVTILTCYIITFSCITTTVCNICSIRSICFIIRSSIFIVNDQRSRIFCSGIIYPFCNGYFIILMSGIRGISISYCFVDCWVSCLILRICHVVICPFFSTNFISNTICSMVCLCVIICCCICKWKADKEWIYSTCYLLRHLCLNH